MVVLAAWAAGHEIAFGDPGAPVVFAAEDRLDEALAAGAGEVVGLSLRPMAGRLAAPPVGVLDFAEEVPGHGDAFRARAAAPSVTLDGHTYGDAELLAAGPPLAASDRVLTVADPGTVAGLVAGLVAPLAAGARIIACRNLDLTTLERRAAVEGVTATVGLDLPGTTRLG